MTGKIQRQGEWRQEREEIVSSFAGFGDACGLVHILLWVGRDGGREKERKKKTALS